MCVDVGGSDMTPADSLPSSIFEPVFASSECCDGTVQDRQTPTIFLLEILMRADSRQYMDVKDSAQTPV